MRWILLLGHWEPGQLQDLGKEKGPFCWYKRSPFGIVRFVVPYGGITEDQVRYGFIGCVKMILSYKKKVNT